MDCRNDAVQQVGCFMHDFITLYLFIYLFIYLYIYIFINIALTQTTLYINYSAVCSDNMTGKDIKAPVEHSRVEYPFADEVFCAGQCDND